jgi:hypothetical protein
MKNKILMLRNTSTFFIIFLTIIFNNKLLAQTGCITPLDICRSPYVYGPGTHWIDICTAGTDSFLSLALAGIDNYPPTSFDCIEDVSMDLFGPVKIERSNPLDIVVQDPIDGHLTVVDGHHDVIQTEMVYMKLEKFVGGVYYRLRAGAANDHLQILPPTAGYVIENSSDPSIGDSFFDIFFELSIYPVPGMTDTLYLYNHFTDPLQLLSSIIGVPPINSNYLHVNACVGCYTDPLAGILIMNLVNPLHHVGNILTWCGTISNDWGDPHNWEPDIIPEDTLDVVIPNGRTNYPTISPGYANHAYCHNIYFKDGASILGNDNLTVSGLAYIERYVHGTFQFCSWLNDSLTMDGEVHYLSSPISDAVDSTVEQDAAFKWLEPSQFWHPIHHFCSEACLPCPFIWCPGIGYSVFTNVFWYCTTPCTTYLNPPGLCAKPWKPQHYREFIGKYMNSGSITVDLTYTIQPPGMLYEPGWNLLGNPYPSALNWNLVLTDGNVYENSACYWNGGSGGYSYVVGNNGFIPIVQGFFVQCAPGGGTVTFVEDARIHNNDYPIGKDAKTDFLSLKVTNSINNYSDETFIQFTPDATPAFDLLDGGKLGNLPEAPMLYSISEDNILVAYNALPSINENPVVPVYFKPGVTGNHTLTANGIESFDINTPIFLEDIVSGISQDLKVNPVYTFAASTVDNIGRFKVHFAPVGFNNRNFGGINIFSVNKDVFVNVPEFENGKIVVVNLLGIEVLSKNIEPGCLNKITLPVSTGYYIIKVITSDQVITQKVFIN